MIYFILIALASLIYAGTWMMVAPSRALIVVKSFSTTLSRFDGTSELLGIHTIRESTQVRAAFRLLGLALIVLSVNRLIELA
jgi:hypothetical protein